MGIVCFAVLLSLGEMSTKFPSKKGFAGHATRCIDPAFGFATALVYLCKYLILSPNQIVAGALVIRFWNNEINSAAWVCILIAFVVAINCLGIKWFGEVEFWLVSATFNNESCANLVVVRQDPYPHRSYSSRTYHRPRRCQGPGAPRVPLLEARQGFPALQERRPRHWKPRQVRRLYQRPRPGPLRLHGYRAYWCYSR